MSQVSSLSDGAQSRAVAQFQTEGYVVLRQVMDVEACAALVRSIQAMLEPLVGPAEFEAEVGYPGAPETHQAGAATPRRLLHAYARSAELRGLAGHPHVVSMLGRLLSAPVRLSQCHHNCIMTKHPGYSSATAWHQDIRYWSFDRPELISAWFALGDETRRNGGLRLIPASHRLDLDRGRLDKDLFLRPELPINKQLIHQSISVDLQAGDVLLFHCQLFHAAGKNRSAQVKLSPVFTYHAADNQPVNGTRSDQFPSIEL